MIPILFDMHYNANRDMGLDRNPIYEYSFHNVRKLYKLKTKLRYNRLILIKKAN